MRSKLWSREAQIPRADLSATPTLLAGLDTGDADAEAHDAGHPGPMAKTIH